MDCCSGTNYVKPNQGVHLIVTIVAESENGACVVVTVCSVSGLKVPNLIRKVMVPAWNEC